MNSDALAVCRAHRGLPVGFLLLQYSVCPYLCFIALLYLALYVLGDDALKVRGISCKPNIYVS